MSSGGPSFWLATTPETDYPAVVDGVRVDVAVGGGVTAVGWNPAERSWDCPCHGSRYDGEGRAIQAPTTKDLKRRRLPEDLR